MNGVKEEEDLCFCMLLLDWLSVRMPSFSRGLWGDMEEGLARLEEEGELDAVEEGEEWWLCWIRSGR